MFLSNLLGFGATTIAAIFQDRWQVELFFKAVKQNLKIKTFVGTSAKFKWSLSNLMALLRQQLFVYRDLYQWLDDPFQAPPVLAGVHDAQLQLGLER